MKRAAIQYLYLGRVDYAEGLRLQAELVDLRQRGRIDNTLLLLEHPPVLTLGRNASRGNVLASDDLLASRRVSLHEINRGGDVTYHGPGQLVGYPIFDLRSLRNPSSGLRLGPVDFVRLMEAALIRVCGDYGVAAGRICKLTGVWCGLPAEHAGAACAAAPQSVSGGRKICAIGIHVARGVTSHGFAFNVRTDLRDFMLINPCGITDRPVTSLEREAADAAALPGLEAIARQTARHFGAVFDEPLVELDGLAELVGLAELRARSAEGAEPGAAASEFPEQESTAPKSSAPAFPAPAFPAVDTPLQVPPAIERLQGKRERPVRA